MNSIRTDPRNHAPEGYERTMRLLDALFAIYEVRLDENEPDELRGCHQARMQMRYIAQEAIFADARNQSAPTQGDKP